jgi:hypothetical protein
VRVKRYALILQCSLINNKGACIITYFNNNNRSSYMRHDGNSTGHIIGFPTVCNFSTVAIIATAIYRNRSCYRSRYCYGRDS